MTGLRVLFVHSVRERLSNMTRNLLAGGVFLVPPVMAAFEGGGGRLPGETPAMWLSLIFGAGLIGPDASSGVLELVLTRPVTRSQYVLARWLSAVCLAATAAVGQTAVVSAIMAFGGNAPGWVNTGVAVTTELTVAIGVPSVLVAFSAVTRGYGDLGAWVLCLITGGIAGFAGQVGKKPWLGRVGEEIVKTMVPVIDREGLTAMASFPWTPAVAWLSTVTLGLAVAIVVLNRKELSHGGS